MNAVNIEIENGKSELSAEDNIKGILSLGARIRIWRAMTDPADAEVSYHNRIALKMLSVRHVQERWETAFPGNNQIDDMLTLTQGLVDRRITPDQAEPEADDFLVEIYDEVDDSNELQASVAPLADGAAHMVTSACFRNSDFDTADYIEDDDELLPDSLETSYCCASVVAGALNWMPVDETDVAARRGFWLWYLDEAIPAVLAS
ncbi:immunity protein [Actinomyces viscosus]|nr:immunity protein [Actinomyces viscosus]